MALAVSHQRLLAVLGADSTNPAARTVLPGDAWAELAPVPKSVLPMHDQLLRFNERERRLERHFSNICKQYDRTLGYDRPCRR
jgi:hypothetical protein